MNKKKLTKSLERWFNDGLSWDEIASKTIKKLSRPLFTNKHEDCPHDECIFAGPDFEKCKGCGELPDSPPCAAVPDKECESIEILVQRSEPFGGTLGKWEEHNIPGTTLHSDIPYLLNEDYGVGGWARFVLVPPKHNSFVISSTPNTAVDRRSAPGSVESVTITLEQFEECIKPLSLLKKDHEEFIRAVLIGNFKKLLDA